MNAALMRRVFRRARDRCEYCLMPQACYRIPFQIDHVVAKQHGGQTEEQNLALACFPCNVHKGPNLAGIDPVTRQMHPLFNPRHDDWDEHFRWDSAELLGKTAIGRVTVAVLAINLPDRRLVRQILIAEGKFPPHD